MKTPQENTGLTVFDKQIVICYTIKSAKLIHDAIEERGEADVPHKTLYAADNTVHGDHSMCGTEKDVSQ